MHCEQDVCRISCTLFCNVASLGQPCGHIFQLRGWRSSCAVGTNPRVSRPWQCYTKIVITISTILSSACNEWLSSNNDRFLLPACELMRCVVNNRTHLLHDGSLWTKHIQICLLAADCWLHIAVFKSMFRSAYYLSGYRSLALQVISYIIEYVVWLLCIIRLCWRLRTM